MLVQGSSRRRSQDRTKQARILSGESLPVKGNRETAGRQEQWSGRELGLHKAGAGQLAEES